MSFLATSASQSPDDWQDPIPQPATAPVGDLSWLSHDLRTPMTSLKGAIDLLASDTFGSLPPALVPLVAIAHRNSDRLANLLEDLLQVGRPDTTHDPIAFQRTDLGLLVREMVAAHQCRAQIAEQRITLTDQSGDAWVLADPRRLQRALHRLMDNATRAALSNTHIALSLERVGHILRLSFRHQGPAMAATNGGTGYSLGLTIAQNIIAAHGGTLFHTQMPRNASMWHADFPQVNT